MKGSSNCFGHYLWMVPIKAKGSSSAVEGGGEKMLRAMQLIDPDIDPEAVFATSAAADDTLDEDGLADDDDQPGAQFKRHLSCFEP